MAVAGSKQLQVPTFLTRRTVGDSLSWLISQSGGGGPDRLTTTQMRAICSSQSVPSACKATLKHMVAGLSWWLADGPEPDSSDIQDTEEGKHYYRVLRDMMDDNGNLVGFSEAIDLFADDILNAREGGCWEVIRDKGGVAQAVLHVDAATIRFTHDPKRPVFQVSPWGEVSELWEADRFGQARWHPLPQMGAALLNRTPVQLAYTAIAILTGSDTYNFKIIAEPIPAGLLNLGPGFNREKALQWKASWDASMRGIQPEPIHVIYGTPNFQYQAFRPPPRDMAFDTTFHNYASLVAACFEMSILDISILTRVATKAAAEVQAEATERQGLRHLMKKVSEAIEKYILPEGVFFHFEDISPKDELAEADIATKETSRIVQAVQGKLLTEEQGFEILQQLKHIPADMKYAAAEFEKRKADAQEQFQQKQEAKAGEEQTALEAEEKKAKGEEDKAKPPPAKKEVGKAAVEKAEQSSEELLSRQLKEKPLKPLKAGDEYWETSEEYLEELQARVNAEIPPPPRKSEVEPEYEEDVEDDINLVERVVAAMSPLITKAFEVFGKKEPPDEVHVHLPAQPTPVIEMPDIKIDLPEQPAPNVQTQVDVHVPKSDGLEKALVDLADRPAPSVVVNVPAQPPAQITVEGPEITVESPKVDVHVPEQPAPQVTVEPQITVENPEVEVHVEAELKMPDKEIETETVVERDEMGRIISTRKRTRKARRP